MVKVNGVEIANVSLVVFSGRCSMICQDGYEVGVLESAPNGVSIVRVGGAFDLVITGDALTE